MTPSAVRELWGKLAAAGLTIGAMPESGKGDAPWYVRVILGIAGSIAAVFLLGFTGMAFPFVFQNKSTSLTVGLMVIAVAYAMFRMAPRNDFTAMFALAVSIAGQGLAAFGVFGVFEHHLKLSFLPWTTVAVLQAVLAVTMPNFIHRVGSAYAAGLAFAYACEMSPVAAGVVAAAVAAVWLNETRLGRFHAILTPIGYGLTLAFVQIEGGTLLGHAMPFLLRVAPGAGSWVGEALVLAALVVSVGVLLTRATWALTEPKALFALIAAAGIGAASFKAPGIAGGLLIALLGFANGNVVLVGLGIAALLVYVSSYYYLLEATLLLKSGVLLTTGIVLLATRWLVLRAVLPSEGPDA